ncbi:uncharacterized protein LOC121776786 [Salvia splendens]|uniref:uncharacterized protein LOC121776786 n=1 Tax=Salvia splendens TaxID=180675 RepID=UPI001C25BBE2|nr:uncharacterized protein LOC121776786 [Salvia splendens]
MEPLTTPNPDRFSKALGLSLIGSNTSGKIWLFVEEGATFDIDCDTEQILHGRLMSHRLTSPLAISAVYAKCTRSERYPLWDRLREIAWPLERTPWIVGGDFNTILLHRDRIGSDTNRQAEMVDFAEAIEDCRLLDPGFDGADFTWAKNGLFERLDRVLVSEAWTRVFEATRVTNLPRIASDHGPVLARCNMSISTNGGKAFRFLNMWIRHEAFMAVVQNAWEEPTRAGGLLNTQIKYARVKSALKKWNKEVFGNIHANVKDKEEAIELAQSEFEARPTPQNRTTINKHIAEYILLLRMEEDFWRQKAALRWLAEGIKNTRFYQSWVKQKRVRLRIHSIRANGPELIEEEDIKKSAVDFFQQLLAPSNSALEEPDLDLIQQVHSDEHFADIAKVIAPNQSGFVKGRLLNDNALLAQEMFHELARCSPVPNVAVKIDMAKAYERVQWPFLFKVLRRMGFPEAWISLMEGCISSCWFSILINGAPSGFFKSTRGLRQGDPISPALFVIAADYLSRALDKLILGQKEMTFKASRRCIEISHLAYADDLIIFTQVAATSLRRLRACLENFEKVSGQEISLAKSNFYIAEIHEQWASSIQAEEGFSMGAFPFLYLGVPIYRGVKRTDMFLFLREKIARRVSGELSLDERGSPTTRVSEYIRNGSWDAPKLQLLHDQAGIPQHIIDHILNTPILHGEKDIPRWTLSKHGEFTVASTWDTIRGQHPLIQGLGNVWKAGLTTSIAIFI